MPPTAPDHRDGEDAESPGLPAPAREELLRAVLVACGDRGFRGASLGDVLQRCGIAKAGFEAEFASVVECYTAAYERRGRQLCDEILAAGAAAPSWREGLRAALLALTDFLTNEPIVARALLVEVHLAGRPAQRIRQKMFERLSRAIDSARRETASRHSPPPLTALFMVNAIDFALTGALTQGEPERYAEIATALEQIVVLAYFGGEP